MEIGSVLRESRVNAKMSVEQVSNILTSCGYKASQKTVYSWENGNSRPDIEILMKLCDIYGIKDILRTFGYDGYKEDGSIQLNLKEIEHIEKYRSLDPYGQETISYILDRECERVSSLQEKDKQIAGLERSINQSSATLRIYTYMRKIASAGKGFYFEDIPTDTIEAPYHEDADFIIGVSGDSMEPTYSDGDMVYVQKCQIVNIGEIGIFVLNNECLIKEAGEDGLISHNPKYPLIAGSENILCVGKVLGKVTLC